MEIVAKMELVDALVQRELKKRKKRNRDILPP
jgi:hypothetical protein